MVEKQGRPCYSSDMNDFIIILTYLIAGNLMRRTKFPKNTGNVLNLFVIYLSLPALILLKIPELQFSRELLIPAVMPWVMLLLSACFILVLSKRFKWERPVTGALLLLVPLGNTSFLGIPMVQSFFGPQAVSYAVLYDQLGSFLALATYGSLIIALYSRAEARLSFFAIGKKIVAFPPFLALVGALMLKGLTYPLILKTFLHSLAETLVPLVMVAVGFQLTLQVDKGLGLPLCFGLGIKLVLAPVTALLLCRFLGLRGLPAAVSIFEAGMPPMVSAGALAMLAGFVPPLTAALVGLGIVLSFITLPLLYQLL